MEPTLFQDPARKMTEIADKQIQPAREAVEMIPLTDTEEARLASATEVAKKLDEALKSVEKVVGELGRATAVAEQVAELTDLAKTQEQLAQAAEEQAQANAAREAMTPETPQAVAQAEAEELRQMREWQRQQQQVEAKLAELLKQSPKLFARCFRSNRRRLLRSQSNRISLPSSRPSSRRPLPG